MVKNSGFFPQINDFVFQTSANSVPRTASTAPKSFDTGDCKSEKVTITKVFDFAGETVK